MGTMRSEPCLKKESHTFDYGSLTVAISSMCGWRPYMEDVHILQRALKCDPEASLFAIFDGHCGPEISQYCAAHFIEVFEPILELQGFNYALALKKTFLRIDEILEVEAEEQLKKIQKASYIKGNNDKLEGKINSGCTANVCIITRNFVYCANAGDSRSIGSINGNTIALSKDHKPNDTIQLKRIVEAGGVVTNGRINNSLNLSRGLGDFQFKKQKNISPEKQLISCIPDVKCIQRKGFQWILMGCDGIWELRSNEQTKIWIDRHLSLWFKTNSFNFLKHSHKSTSIFQDSNILKLNNLSNNKKISSIYKNKQSSIQKQLFQINKKQKKQKLDEPNWYQTYQIKKHTKQKTKIHQMHKILQILLNQTIDYTQKKQYGKDNMSAILIKFNN